MSQDLSNKVGVGDNELLYSMAFARAFLFHAQTLNHLLEEMGSATALYGVRNCLKDAVPDASEQLTRMVAQVDDFLPCAEQEMEFAAKSHIQIITRNAENYPIRLQECPDAPAVIYYRGTSDLNSRYILSIVGTRKATEYGKSFCRHFLADLAHYVPEIIIVSGLAYGIDIQAHRQSLENGLQTIGVLAHGLDQIYPRMHRQTAIDMLSHGGLLTEFMSCSKVDKVNFVSRNRIVAGLSDATLVVESAEKGGSLITARIAMDYNRSVFAVPGRVGDTSSSGCNALIRDNRAGLIQNAEDFLLLLGWESKKEKPQAVQRELFPNLSPEEMLICSALQHADGKHINQLATETNLPVSRLNGLLFDLEMKGIVRMMSGGMYRLY